MHVGGGVLNTPDISGVGGWNLGLSGVGFSNFFIILHFIRYKMNFLDFSQFKSGVNTYSNKEYGYIPFTTCISLFTV